jgi:hypothetical protein
VRARRPGAASTSRDRGHTSARLIRSQHGREIGTLRRWRRGEDRSERARLGFASPDHAEAEKGRRNPRLVERGAGARIALPKEKAAAFGADGLVVEVVVMATNPLDPFPTYIRLEQGTMGFPLWRRGRTRPPHAQAADRAPVSQSGPSYDLARLPGRLRSCCGAALATLLAGAPER